MKTQKRIEKGLPLPDRAFNRLAKVKRAVSLQRPCLWSKLIILFVLLSFSFPTASKAESITFLFSGFITGIVDQTLLPTIGGNTPFTGKYSFESTAPDQRSLPTQGEYIFGSPFSLTVNIDGLSFTQDLTKIIVFNDLPSGAGSFLDRYYIRADGATPSEFTELTLDERRSTPPSFLQNDSLPLNPPDLSLVNVFPNFQFFTEGLGFGGTIDSVTAIPEPSTLFLFGTGLAGLAAWRYRKSMYP